MQSLLHEKFLPGVRLTPALRTALVAFCVSRPFCALFVYVGHLSRPFLKPVPGGWTGVENWWLNPWTTYDSFWYISIAQGGYQEVSTPFFPLYPLLLRLGGSDPVGMALVGVLLSNLCFLFSLAILYRLTERDYGPVTARLAVWVLAFFPTTAFFSAVYTESLFLLLVLLCFEMAHSGRWWRAGLAGLLAALTRNPGLLLSLALLMEYLQQRPKGVGRWSPGALLPLALPAAGFLAVQSFFWVRFGEAGVGIASQTYYGRFFDWPWQGVFSDLLHLTTTDSLNWFIFVNLFITFSALIMAGRFSGRLRRSHLVLLLGIMAMHLFFPRIIPPHTFGSMRYLSTAFPFVQLLAWSVVAAPPGRLLQLGSLGLLLYLNMVCSDFFGAKGFLG